MQMYFQESRENNTTVQLGMQSVKIYYIDDGKNMCGTQKGLKKLNNPPLHNRSLSGLFRSQFNTFMFEKIMELLTFLDFCTGELSCWKTKSST